MNNPKVSIIIPVYNGANYMREAIDSALAQTYDNFEVLVVNDGSNDGGQTRNIALSYGARIRYFEKENGGVATALNLGIEQMRGEYFSWLSHDDLYHPDKLKMQIDTIRKTGNWKAIVFSDWDTLDMEKGERRTRKLLDQYPLYYLEQSIAPLVYGIVHGCTLLIHKSHFERVGIFDETLLATQDYDLWFQMFRDQKLVFIPSPLISSRVHPQQGTRTMPCVAEEGRQLYLKIASSFDVKEIERIFGHPFLFYYRILNLLNFYGMHDSFQILEERYQISKIFESFGQTVREWFCEQGWGGCKLCIFCCGENGKHMLSGLSALGFAIDYFSDNNSELWGEFVNEIPCISPSELQKIGKDTLILVSVHNPDPIVRQLKNMGCSNIITKQFFDRRLFELAAP